LTAVVSPARRGDRELQGTKFMKNNRYGPGPIVLALFLVTANCVFAEEAGSPLELLTEAIETIPEVSFRAELKLSSHGLTRELDLMQRKIGEKTYAMYLEVTGPHNVKDTRFLFKERLGGRDEQFVYLPALRRAVQIGEHTREQPFLGSEFYVSDLVAPDPEAFELKFVGAGEFLGRKCKLVEAVPKNPDEWSYSRAVYAVDPVDRLILRADFYDKSGKLLKIWTAERLGRVGEFWTPYLQRMKNVQENVTSEVEVVKIEYDIELPEKIFSREHLAR
jgi:hypothetical protein